MFVFFYLIRKKKNTNHYIIQYYNYITIININYYKPINRTFGSWLGQEQRWNREMTTLLERREDLQRTLDDARQIPGFVPENSDFFKGKPWKIRGKAHGNII